MNRPRIVVIVSAEGTVPYERPPLSKEFLLAFTLAPPPAPLPSATPAPLSEDRV